MSKKTRQIIEQGDFFEPAEFILQRNRVIDLPRKDIFPFFADAGNLERITPPELNFQIVTPQPIDLKKGSLIDYKLKLNGIPPGWRTEITQWNPPFDFVDTALKSPYKQWIHLHKFTVGAHGETIMEDIVRYRLPVEPFGDIIHFLIRR